MENNTSKVTRAATIAFKAVRNAFCMIGALVVGIALLSPQSGIQHFISNICALAILLIAVGYSFSWAWGRGSPHA